MTKRKINFIITLTILLGIFGIPGSTKTARCFDNNLEQELIFLPIDINDNAGTSDTGYAWSADKLSDIAYNQLLSPFVFTSDGLIFNGSNLSAIDQSAKQGYIFDGFDKITDTGVNTTFGIAKEIVSEKKPGVLDTGGYLDFAVFAVLKDNNDSVNCRITFSTGKSWNANTQSLLRWSGKLVNGWNKITLSVTSTASSLAAYNFLFVLGNSLTELQKIDKLCIFPYNNFFESKDMSYDVDLLFWGDSLTKGSGGDGTTYPQVCASELGKTYLNCGVGGETANTIAARQGGNNIIIPAGDVNRTYAVDELLDIFGYHVNPIRQGHGKNSGNAIFINGQKCDLSIEQSTSTSSDAVYTISGYTGDALSAPTLGTFAGSDFTGRVVVIFVGQNGSYVNDLRGIEARIILIDSMISHLNHNRYVILGLSSGNQDNREEEDNMLLAKYGNKFFPTRKLLVNYGLQINNLTPTEEDLQNIEAGTVPASLRADNIHLNSYGYTALGKLLADKIRSLGYFD